MNLTIRPVRIEDAVPLNEMRRMDGVRENTLGIISERLSRGEDFIKGLTDNDHLLVAEIEENGSKKVVGSCALQINRNRMRHSASLGIAVHPKYQGKGIGKALMTKILDLADNWLMLVRVELGVFVDNTRAINLYKSMGFEIEGTRRYAAIRNGEFVDEYIMARYRNLPQKKSKV